MCAFQIKTPSEQLAEYLREQIFSGKYRGVMPGKAALAKEVGVDPKTAALAMDLLEKEKLLATQGAGRPRRINRSTMHKDNSLKIILLCYEKRDRQIHYILELVRQLTEQGHTVQFAQRSLMEMKMDPRKVASEVRRNPADAWIVLAGSADVLRWFAQQDMPSFALFGRTESARIASTGVRTYFAYRELVKRLVALGHRRIVLLVREERRKPEMGRDEVEFLQELRAQGIPAGSYHVPDWEDNIEGLQRCLDSLFALTPPTALIISMPELFIATYQHLLKRGLRVPEDVSLFSSDYDHSMSWCQPSVAHFRWELGRVLRWVLNWSSSLARGDVNLLKQTFVVPEIVDGGTIGPAPKS